MSLQPWDLDDALTLVRALQPDALKFGYHIALGGSVLNRGESKKDVDLYFLPFDNGKDIPKPTDLVRYLENIWGPGYTLGGSTPPPYDETIENVVFRDTFTTTNGEVARLETPSGIRWASTPFMESPPLKSPDYPSNGASPYQFKLKFIRGKKDCIDVFIVK